MASVWKQKCSGLATFSSAVSKKYGTNSMVSVQGRRDKQPVSLAKKILFARRIILILVGNVTVVLLIWMTFQMHQSASGVERLVHTYTLDSSLAMRQWIGTTTIRQSPLVEIALQGRIDPLNQTLYLKQDGSSSFQQCEGLSKRQQQIYSDQWQRVVFSRAVVGTASNFTFLSNITLIAPVVDCGSMLIRSNDSTRAKFYFLSRDDTNRRDVQLLTLAMAVQEYWIPSETQKGSAAVASLTLVKDLQAADHVDHYFAASLGYPFYDFDFKACELIDDGTSGIMYQLQTIPRNQARELPQLVQTAYRSGFYLTFESRRFNIRQQIWLLENTPINAITTWTWTSKNTSQDIWALAHILGPIFGVYLIGHLTQVCTIFHQARKEGKWFMPDASVPMIKPFLFGGALVALLWYFTSFWALLELCLSDAHDIAGIDEIFVFYEIMLVDILFMMQNLSGYLARALRGRVDIAFVFCVGCACFIFRLYIIQLFPSLVASIEELTLETVQQELQSSVISPMQLRAPYAIRKYPVKLMLSVMTPHYLTIPLAIAFIFLRKAYYRLHPTPMIVYSTQKSTAEGKLSLKTAYTNFELATGAQFEMMYGLLSEFDNYIFIKGMRFASADGIYGAGFLIVNKKFLVQVNDIWAILLIKLFRVRYTNVYIFSLSGTAVQRTALIVYPDTMTVYDLLHLGVSTLA